MEKMPSNQVFFDVYRHFSPEGFAQVDIMNAFVEIGFSKAAARRLFNSDGVVVWDTRLDGNRIEWYKRRAEEVELLEPDDAILFGKRAVIVHAIMPAWYKRLFYWIRPYYERYYEKYIFDTLSRMARRGLLR